MLSLVNKIRPGLKDKGIQRTKQKSWPFYSGIKPKVTAVEEMFEFIDLLSRVHYKKEHAAWVKPSSDQIKAALETLLDPPPG